MLSFVLRGIFPIGAFAWHWFDWLVLKIYLGRLAKPSQVKESKKRSIHFPLQVLNAMEDATKLWMWLYLLRWIEFGSSTVLGTAHLVTMSILVQTKHRNRENSEFKLKQESNVLCLEKVDQINCLLWSWLQRVVWILLNLAHHLAKPKTAAETSQILEN